MPRCNRTNCLPREEFYMRKFEDLNPMEKDVLILGEVKSILRALQSDNDTRWLGLDRLIIDYDSLVYFPSNSSKSREDEIDKFAESLIKEATYRCESMSVPSDLIIRD